MRTHVQTGPAIGGKMNGVTRVRRRPEPAHNRQDEYAAELLHYREPFAGNFYRRCTSIVE